MVMMTRRKGLGRKHRPTSIELQTKPTLNGVSQNGRAPNGRSVLGRRHSVENGPTSRREGDVLRPRVPPVAFSDQLDDSGAAGLSCSVEALSLIPGRDINHEGPHRVYQWADF